MPLTHRASQAVASLMTGGKAMASNAQDAMGWRPNPWRRVVWGTAAFLLLLPLVAMQFTEEVNWGEVDFIVFGAILIAACGAYELATRLSGNSTYRAAFGLAVAAAFILVWIILAVGIIESENNAADLMFGGVFVVGIIGALIARFQPRGMARALMAMALAQALVCVVALVLGSVQGVALSGFFAALWLGSAWLFRKAARQLSNAG